MARTINSAGVEITETDLTLSPVLPAGQNVFLTGFAAKGPTDQLLTISSTQEFEQIYGAPTTAAERYLYYTAKQILDTSSSTVMVNRLPYGASLGDGFGSKYSALVYPVTTCNTLGVFTSNVATPSATYFLGAPKFFELTQSEYLSAVDGSAFSWTGTSKSAAGIASIADFGSAGVVVLNKAQTTTNNKFEGYYLGVADNTNLLPTTDFDGIVKVNSINTATSTPALFEIPSSRLDFSLSALKTAPNGSISETLENIPSFDTYADKYDDTLSFGVYKLYQSPFATDTILLDYKLEEAYVGSLDYYRQINDVNGGNAKSFFIGQVDNKSNNISILVNDSISNRASASWADSSGIPTKHVRLLTNSIKNQYVTNSSSTSANVGVSRFTYLSAIDALNTADSLNPLGAYTDQTYTNKALGNIPGKIDRAIQKVDNDEVVDLDFVVEGGLGTIYVASQAAGTTYYDDTALPSGLIDGLNALTTTGEYVATGGVTDLRTNYNTIFNKFNTLTQNIRKDCLFVADPIRHILVRGESIKTLSDVNKSFSQYIYSALRHQFETVNTSYSCVAGNWSMVNDSFSGINIWVPFSGFATADMINTPEPWSAAAGFTRGRVVGASDLAIYPKQKERDQLAKIGINPVSLFPGEGFVIFGQKTLLKQPSAFDRINVRRLFLYLEKATKKTLRYFLFEPNTLYTRTRVVDTLTPIFERAKATDGVYEYLLICNDKNNTPSVIDQNEMVVSIYVKPVRTAEFILANFYATKTGVNFNEITG